MKAIAATFALILISGVANADCGPVTSACKIPDAARTLGIYTIEVGTSCYPASSLRFALHEGGHSIPKGWAQMAIDSFEALP